MYIHIYLSIIYLRRGVYELLIVQLDLQLRFLHGAVGNTALRKLSTTSLYLGSMIRIQYGKT